MKFINFHTHTKNNDAIVFSVLNTYPNLAKVTVPFSIGIHPWYLNENTLKKKLLEIESSLQNKNCIALGECGLDKIITTDFDFQKEVFIRQIYLSEKYKKPLIIHCVKAFDEVITIKKELKPKQIWILHGFNKSNQLAKSLLKNGFLLSFGKALLIKESLQKLVAEIDFSQFFLETDDAAIDIKELYQKVALIKKCSIEEVKKEIYQNFKQKMMR